MKKLFACVVASSLLACASPPVTHPKTEVVTVTREVPVKCQFPRLDPPTYAFDDAEISMSFGQKQQRLLAERQQRIAFQKLLEAAIDGCRK